MEANKPEDTASRQRSSAEGGPCGGQSPPDKTVVPDIPSDVALLAAQWESALNVLPDPIAILDTHYRLVQVNAAMAGRLGLTKQQCLGQSCCTLIHGTDTPPSFCPHSKLLQDGEEHTAEIYEQSLGGDFLVTVTPLRDSTGRLVGCIHVARDITQRK